MLLALMDFAAAQAPACAPLMTAKVLQVPAVAEAFHAWVCSTRFVSHREFIDAGVAEGVPAYGQPVASGVTLTAAERDAWKIHHCTAAQVAANPAEAALSLWRALPVQAVQAFAGCRNASTDRLVCTVAAGAGGTMLHVRWQGDASRHHGIRPQLLTVDVAGATVLPAEGAVLPPSVPDGVATLPLVVKPCAALAAVVETSFGYCAVPAYVPGRVRRDVRQWSYNNAQGLPYTQVDPVPTQNRGHLVRHLQIESRTVALRDPAGEIVSVGYACRNPVNFDRCPWSRNPDKEDTSANVVIAADRKSYTWKRLWSGDPVDDIYTVRYRVPRTVCVGNCECPAS